MTIHGGSTSNLAIILTGTGGSALANRVEAYLLDRGMREIEGPWIDHTDWTKKQLEDEADLIKKHGGKDDQKLADRIRENLANPPEGVGVDISGSGFTVTVVITGPDGQTETLVFSGDDYAGMDESEKLAAVHRFVDQVLRAIAAMSGKSSSRRS